MKRTAPADSTPEVASSAGAWKVHPPVFFLLLLLYGLTAQRGPAWQDSGIFQWRILNFDVIGWMGLALSHPLLIMIGKLFSLAGAGSLAWRMNMVSAVFMALAGANVALLVRRLAGQGRAAWIAAGLFALAHSPWWLATICESQALLAALFTAELNVLLSVVRRPQPYQALLLGLLNGLALTAHDLALLALPAYALAVFCLCLKRRLGWPAMLWLALGWAIGAGSFLTLIVHRAGDTSLGQAVHSALFGDSWRGNVLGGSPRAVARGFGYVLYNFPNVALPAMVVGLAVLKNYVPRLGRWALGYLLAAYFLFAIRYAVPDQFMFFLPFYAMSAALAGVAIAHLTSAGRRRALLYVAAGSLAIGPLLYAAAPAAWKALSLPLPGRQNLPYRDAHRYWLWPWKSHEDSAGRFARSALESVPAGATIVVDGTSFPPLAWVQRVEGLRTDVRLLECRHARPDVLPAGTPDVFVVSDQAGYRPEWLAEAARLEKQAPGDVLFHVRWH